MKSGFAILAVAVLVLSGCVSKQPTPTFSEPPDSPTPTPKPIVPAVTTNSPAASKKKPDTKLIVTPENVLTGSVATYNSAGRFVVLNFPVGKMPARDLVMFVYRQGLKVGEVKIVGPERDHMTIGDLVAGEAQKGDEVRDRN